MTLIVILQYKNQQNEKIRVHIIICNQPHWTCPKCMDSRGMWHILIINMLYVIR